MAVQPVRDLEGIGWRLIHGSRGFRIITSAKGLRSMALDIGDRIVVGSVDDVQAAISHFIGCDRP